MLVVKRCKCGCTHFEREPDDDVLRCADCWSRAEFAYISDNAPVDNDKEDDEK